MKTNNNYKTKDKTMRFIYTLSIASLLFFFGCDQGSDLISPLSESPTKQLKLISIPAPSGGLSVETLVTKYKEIDGDDGGEFTANFSYSGGPFGTVIVESELDFDSDAFEGERLISQTLDTDFAAMKFGPSMQFYDDIGLDLVITGLDLSGIDPNTLDFVYINEDGTIEHVEYDDIIVNVSTGTIEVDDAELTHFSRYGFVN
jgi:hypothetical protein